MSTSYNRKDNYAGEAKSSRGALIFTRIVVYICLAVLMIICLFFFYLMLVNSSRSNNELMGGFSLWFSKYFGQNFLKAVRSTDMVNITLGMWNSFLVAALSSILTTYFSALTAFGIHAYDFRGKKAAFTFIMAVMMIPPQVSAVGFIQLCYKFNLTDNYLPLIIPSIAAPVVFFYMKQYMDSVLPLEIIEAARVDGSSEFRTFNTIVFPIMKPAMAVQMIFSFVGSWNNYFTPALLISDKEKATVPIMLATLRSYDWSNRDMGTLYMFMVLAILPVIIIYLFLSKFIIKNVTAGAVKG